ncbi:RecX family transcriptional regulator [Mucilaginibacter sp. RS28]|uniref:Regulatory protein RecX n=1 Tax=Mucilaginibacter straminoryzae TaxID=2932774 RepID=A0A9X1X504_9SPHI|nr:RecX family transcriptional regulator [Mucilaginibacter straminoryzae]MCJ8211197.1 RecX family transcriptional regulator [Mucilaginibacter straminoryzae]
MDEPKARKKITDPKTGLAKAEHYCAYQERSQQEVRDKLYEWGLYPQDIEQIISQLIATNFLNEERFAKAYAQGKLNQKGWGKIKIKQGLKLKRVSDPLIKKALLSLDLDDYLAVLKKILEKKRRLVTEKDAFKRHYKLKQYALSRGFEMDLILDVLKTNDL